MKFYYKYHIIEQVYAEQIEIIEYHMQKAGDISFSSPEYHIWNSTQIKRGFYRKRWSADFILHLSIFLVAASITLYRYRRFK